MVTEQAWLPRSSHPACAASLVGSCWTPLGSKLLDVGNVPEASRVSCKDIMETRRAGLANSQAGLHQGPRKREAARWREDGLDFPASASCLRARPSLRALSWCLIPRQGTGLCP